MRHCVIRRAVPAAVAGLALVAAASRAAIHMSEASYHPLAADPVAIAAAELDDLPGPDVACLTWGREEGRLTIYSRFDGGRYLDRTDLALGRWNGLAAGDLDGDGRTDLVASGDEGVVVWRRVGSLAFAAPETLRAPGGAARPIVADLDGAHGLDIAALNYASEGVSVWLNGGGTAFRERVDYPYGYGAFAQCLAAGDVTGDGLADLVTRTVWEDPERRRYESRITVLPNEGGGGFGPPRYSPGGPSPADDLVLVDLDRNGHPDVVMDTNDRYLSVAYGAGDGAFGPPVLVPRRGRYYPGRLVVADVDGDGWPDVASAILESETVYYERSFVSVFRNEAGILAGRVDYVVTHEPAAVVALDANGDGAVDLAAVTRYGSTVFRPETGPGVLAVLLNLGDGTFGARRDVAVVSARNVVSQAFEVGRVRAPSIADPLFSSRDTTFLVPALGHGLVSPRLAAAPGRLKALRDLDADGLDDLVLETGGAPGAAAVEVRRALGGSAFAPPDPYPGAFVALADADADGLPDLWTRDADGMIGVRKGLAGGRFLSLEPMVVSGGALRAPEAVEDLDGDGRDDLAGTGRDDAVVPGMPFVWVRLAAAAAVFGEEMVMPVAPPAWHNWSNNRPTQIVIGDVDGDGRRDIVLRAGDASGSQWGRALLGVPGATWDTTAAFYLSGVPQHMRLADLDADGAEDLAVVHGDNYAAIRVSVWSYSEAAGGMTLAAQHETGYYPMRVAAGDLEGDGRTDLAVWNAGFATVTLLRSLIGPVGRIPASIGIASASAEPDRARLTWVARGGWDGAAVVERRGDSTAWAEIDRIRPGAGGVLACVDPTVAEGARYAYRLSYEDGGVPYATAEAWVEVPRSGVALSAPWPNPARGVVEVVLARVPKGPAEIVVHDVMGRRVWSRALVAADRESRRLRLETRGWPAGLYFVALRSGGQRSTVRVAVVR